jgi:hypothetical protein
LVLWGEFHLHDSEFIKRLTMSKARALSADILLPPRLGPLG